MNTMFRLCRRQELLRIVEHTEEDFPNYIGVFHPEKAFKADEIYATQRSPV